MKGNEITVKLADNRFAKSEDAMKISVPCADLYYKPDDKPLTREEEAKRRGLVTALTPTP
jgi:hypothetical protein